MVCALATGETAPGGSRGSVSVGHLTGRWIDLTDGHKELKKKTLKRYRVMSDVDYDVALFS